MKLVTFAAEDRERVGVAIGDGILDAGEALAAAGIAVSPAQTGDMTAFLRWRPDSISVLAAAAKQAAAKGVAMRRINRARLLAPVRQPGKILGVGLNYAAHAAEAASTHAGAAQKPATAKPARPRIFFKAPTAIIGPHDPIVKPAFVTKLDFEGELAAVIGRTARNVDEASALDHLAGLCIANDVSAREFQFDMTPAQTSFAKSMDSFCPLGPWIVTLDELPANLDLRLRTWLNDSLMQDARTNTLIFGLGTLVAYLSRHMTLEPGDIISTGTPDGTGHFRTPPRHLIAGDRVRIEIDGLGVLENPVA